MNGKTAAVMILLLIVVAAVAACSGSCALMLFTKKGLAEPYHHPDKPDEFKPLGKIMDLTPDEVKTRKDAIDKQINPK